MNVEWKAENVMRDELANHLKHLSDTSWLVKHLFWDGVPGLVTVVSMQSAQYAPKQPKKKKGIRTGAESRSE